MLTTHSQSAVLSVSGINKSFSRDGKAVKVLQDVNFSIRSGTLTSIIGPSGCGKTTMLRIVDGLVKADSGEVVFEGRRITTPEPKMAFVFQQFGLLPWRNVLNNVEFGLQIRNVEPEMRRTIAMKYIELVGLRDFVNHYPHELSGGMQQRVGLARALAIDPDVLLMDEPFASVDMQTREILQRELLRIIKGTIRKTTLLVTHNVDEAIFLSDEIILLTTRPASVAKVLKVNLPEERWKFDPHLLPEYTDLRQEIWHFLEQEIMQKKIF